MKENAVILKKILKTLRLLLIILCANLIVLSIGVSSYMSNNKETKEESSEYNTEYDVSMFEEIKPKDVVSKTKKLSLVYVGRSTCSWCAAFLPNLWQAQEEYGYKTLYVDIAKIIDFSNNKISDQTAYDKMMELTGKGYEEYMKENFGSTPMMLVMKNGKIINAQTGYSEYDDFEDMLKESGFKK